MSPLKRKWTLCPIEWALTGHNPSYKDNMSVQRFEDIHCFLRSGGAVIRKLQFVKINDKINKNTNDLVSQTCLMRNIWNMKIFQLFVLKILKNNNRIYSKMHCFYLGSFLTPLVEEWGSDTETAFFFNWWGNKWRCGWPHVADIFCEEYLEYEYVATFRFEDFEEKQPVGSFLTPRVHLRVKGTLFI